MLFFAENDQLAYNISLLIIINAPAQTHFILILVGLTKLAFLSDSESSTYSYVSHITLGIYYLW